MVVRQIRVVFTTVYRLPSTALLTLRSSWPILGGKREDAGPAPRTSRPARRGECNRMQQRSRVGLSHQGADRRRENVRRSMEAVGDEIAARIDIVGPSLGSLIRVFLS